MCTSVGINAGHEAFWGGFLVWKNNADENQMQPSKPDIQSVSFNITGLFLQQAESMFKGRLHESQSKVIMLTHSCFRPEPTLCEIVRLFCCPPWFHHLAFSSFVGAGNWSWRRSWLECCGGFVGRTFSSRAPINTTNERAAGTPSHRYTIPSDSPVLNPHVCTCTVRWGEEKTNTLHGQWGLKTQCSTHMISYWGWQLHNSEPYIVFFSVSAAGTASLCVISKLLSFWQVALSCLPVGKTQHLRGTCFHSHAADYQSQDVSV